MSRVLYASAPLTTESASVAKISETVSPKNATTTLNNAVVLNDFR